MKPYNCDQHAKQATEERTFELASLAISGAKKRESKAALKGEIVKKQQSSNLTSSSNSQ
jgi:hypothetical protein